MTKHSSNYKKTIRNLLLGLSLLVALLLTTHYFVGNGGATAFDTQVPITGELCEQVGHFELHSKIMGFTPLLIDTLDTPLEIQSFFSNHLGVDIPGTIPSDNVVVYTFTTKIPENGILIIAEKETKCILNWTLFPQGGIRKGSKAPLS